MDEDYEGIEESKHRTIVNIIFVLLLFVGILFIINLWIKPFERPNIDVRNFLQECEDEMLNSRSDYIICCADKNGRLYKCSEKKYFHVNEFIAVYADLQRLNKFYPIYYACAFTTPLETNETEQKTIIDDKEVLCTRRFYNKDYHKIYNYGYIKDSSKELTILRLFIFSDKNYVNLDDFMKDIENAKMVLNLTGIVK
ncbi:MAG: hypothetical protein QXD48_03585 [Candidatus Aenigmatarchaeota archaeon]